jgi:hypothetical protein
MDNTSVVFTQTITAPKELQQDLNTYLLDLQTNTDNWTLKTFIEPVLSETNKISLTPLPYVKEWLQTKGVDTKRILLDRNTLLTFK